MDSFSVSVIIPVYNAEKYLEEAVRSAIVLEEVGEVLLIDDASSDSSLEVCRKLENSFKKVRVLEHPDGRNHGAAASRNLGIVHAKYGYVSFLDADDYYLPNRFKIEKFTFQNDPGTDGVYGCTQGIFTSETVRNSFLTNYESEFTTITKQLKPEELFIALLFGGFGRFHTSGITLRKSVFQKTEMFNPTIRQVEDTELWLRLSLKANLVPGDIDTPIAVRRVHETNSIHNRAVVNERTIQLYYSLFYWSLKQDFSFNVRNSFFTAIYNLANPGALTGKQLFCKLLLKGRSIISSFWLKKFYLLYLNG